MVVLYVIEWGLSGADELIGVHEVIEVVDPASGANHAVSDYIIPNIVYISFTPLLTAI